MSDPDFGMVQPFMPKGVIEAFDTNAKGGVVPITGIAPVRAVASPIVAMSVVNLVIGPGIA
jgi:hypothetical protein